MIKKLIFLVTLCLFNINIIAQDTTCFTKDEVLTIFNNIQELEQTDSLKTLLIQEQKVQISNYVFLSKQDSTLLAYKNEEILLLKDRINSYKEYVDVVKPKWWERKMVWFILGMGTVIGSSYVVSNVIH